MKDSNVPPVDDRMREWIDKGCERGVRGCVETVGKEGGWGERG